MTSITATPAALLIAPDVTENVLAHRIAPDHARIGASMAPADNRKNQRPTRRSVVKGAAWAAPGAAVAIAAPALAASGCEPATFSWNTLTAGTRPSTITLIPAAGSRPALTATISISAVTGTQSAASGTVSAGPQGAITGNYYRMEFAPVAANNTMTVTLTFNRPVLSTSFTLLDIDGTETGYRDLVAVTTTGFTASRGSRIIGAGTATGSTATTGPFRMNTPYANIAPTSADGNLGLTFSRSTASLSSVAFRYFNGTVAASQNMVLGLGNITVDPC